jgi:hypothetical protein
MLAQVQTKQADEPEDDGYSNGCEEQLGVVQEWQSVVAQEGDYEVVDQCGKVKRVGEGEGNPSGRWSVVCNQQFPSRESRGESRSTHQ